MRTTFVQVQFQIYEHAILVHVPTSGKGLTAVGQLLRRGGLQ
jgi:hypothetical protein